METNISGLQELQPGTTLNGGKYIIEKKIGEGGFSITYRAEQIDLNRAVCIKEYFLAGLCIRATQGRTVQPLGTSANRERFNKYRTAFITEAQTVAKLHHPNIVDVIEIFDENNTTYMVMPFIEGSTLEDYVREKGSLTYQEAVNYIAQIADAVGYVHRNHILHRDIKPKNIMVTSGYKAMLIDFGSAREYEEDKTQAYTTMYSDGYAPPEQYARNSRKGAYSDIYALGATLYYILTSREPMSAPNRITEPMPTPKKLNPNLPNEAERTIMKAMQLKSENRHQNIIEFMDDLRNIKPSKPVKEKVAKNKIVSIVAAIAVLLIGFGIWWYFSKASIKHNLMSLEEQYEQALALMNSIDTNTFMEGYRMMDSLSQKEEYIPAMYEMAFTLGWYSDPISLRRKDMLGIKYEHENPLTKYMAIDDNDNKNAVDLMMKILKKNDSSYATINGNAAYRLVAYYINKGTFLEENREIAKEYLAEAQKWSQLSGDTVLLAKIEKGKEKIN